MSFPAKVKEDVLVACNRCCCLCHKFCGLKIEIHHIKPRAEGGSDTFDNAIPLCFDCHADMRTYDSNHPKGTKYSENELRRHRYNWYSKIEKSDGIYYSSNIETDKKIYEKLLKILPWKGSLSFISVHSFSERFKLDDLYQLDNFIMECGNPNFEFIDADLESLRAKLLGDIQCFRNFVAGHTFGIGNYYFRVYPELKERNPEFFYKIVDDINDYAEVVCKSYKDLTRVATRKLGITPY